MRIYISGPITGVQDYMQNFSKTQDKLNLQGHSVYNPAAVCAMLPPDTRYEEYMKMAFTMLDMCDVVYMLPGWKKSLGANREYGYAKATEKIIIEGEEDERV